MSSFPSIRIEGGLLGPEVLDQVIAADVPGQKPAEFGLEPKRNLTDEIAAAFADSRALWGVFQHRLTRLPEDDLATTVTCDQWVIPFLGLLGYELTYNARAPALVEAEKEALKTEGAKRKAEREKAEAEKAGGAKKGKRKKATTGGRQSGRSRGRGRKDGGVTCIGEAGKNHSDQRTVAVPPLSFPPVTMPLDFPHLGQRQGAAVEPRV
jgi:hypothetical protein